MIPTRVCHVAYTFYENDNRVIRYAEALAGRGSHVDVIALRRANQPRRGVTNGVRIHRVQRRDVSEKGALVYLLKLLWFLVKAAALVALLHLRRPYDVIHVHNVPDFLVLAALVPRLTGARVILDIHDVLPELYAGKFAVGQESVAFRSLCAIERLCCRFADHVIVANHLWHDKLVRRSVPAWKCTPMLNYPDLSLFAPSAAERPRAGRPFLMLYPGTLNHHQGLDIAIRAFARVQDRMAGAEFHIYGEGPARRELAQLAHECGVATRVRILDRIPLREVPAVMRSADLGIVPKRADGFGNEAFSTKILEFMACGVPVVASRTAIDAHYFDDRLVRFFAPGDEADLARVILDVYEHRDEHAAWIRAAHDFAVEYSWQAHVGHYLQIVG